MEKIKNNFAITLFLLSIIGCKPDKRTIHVYNNFDLSDSIIFKLFNKDNEVKNEIEVPLAKVSSEFFKLSLENDIKYVLIKTESLKIDTLIGKTKLFIEDNHAIWLKDKVVEIDYVNIDSNNNPIKKQALIIIYDKNPEKDIEPSL